MKIGNPSEIQWEYLFDSMLDLFKQQKINVPMDHYLNFMLDNNKVKQTFDLFSIHLRINILFLFSRFWQPHSPLSTLWLTLKWKACVFYLKKSKKKCGNCLLSNLKYWQKLCKMIIRWRALILFNFLLEINFKHTISD